MLSDGGLQSRSGGNRADEDVDLTAYARTTDLAGYATTAALNGYASLSANNTFNGTQTLNSGITVNKTTSNGTAYQYEVDDQGWTVEGPFRVKLGAQNLLTLTPSAHQQPISSAVIGTNLSVTGNTSVTGSMSATGDLSVTGSLEFRTHIIGNVLSSPPPSPSLVPVKPLIYVLNNTAVVQGNPAYPMHQWCARDSQGYHGIIAGSPGYGGYVSDDRLKYNEVAVPNGIEKLTQLQPRHYSKKRSLLDPDENGVEEYGFIAQDVEQIEGLDCLVTETIDAKDPSQLIKTVNYAGITTISVQALKELITRVEDLETRLAALESS